MDSRDSSWGSRIFHSCSLSNGSSFAASRWLLCSLTGLFHPRMANHIETAVSKILQYWQRSFYFHIILWIMERKRRCGFRRIFTVAFSPISSPCRAKSLTFTSPNLNKLSKALWKYDEIRNFIFFPWPNFICMYCIINKSRDVKKFPTKLFYHGYFFFVNLERLELQH